MTAIRIEDEGTVRRLVLCRPDEFNTITTGMRDELGQARDDADRDRAVKVVLLSAEGKAFCAGFGLDWSTQAQAGETQRERVWDSVADVQMIGTFGATFAKLHEISKPTIAAVHGWCIAGGTDRRPPGSAGRPRAADVADVDDAARGELSSRRAPRRRGPTSATRDDERPIRPRRVRQGRHPPLPNGVRRP